MDATHPSSLLHEAAGLEQCCAALLTLCVHHLEAVRAINIVVMRFIATNLKLIGHHFVSFDTKKPYQNFPNISETAAQLTSENS